MIQRVIPYGGQIKVKMTINTITQEVWNDLKTLAVQQLSTKRLFVVDAYCGANADTRLKVRFYH